MVGLKHVGEAKLSVSRRQRATPYTPRVAALGVTDYSVVNHTILPKGFGRSTAEDYWHLRSAVQIWDVGCQRQVEIRGRDAARLAQYLTPRDLSAAEVGQCLYAPLIDDDAGMLNDPIVLRLAEDRFWLSIADADILLWARGLAHGLGFEVEIEEPDVWPLAVQGPRADSLVVRVFGESLRELPFFRFVMVPFGERPLLVARTGYSLQGGFEIYVDGFERGPQVWDALWAAGREFDLAPGSPNLIERIEGGLLSYGNEMTRDNNPLECNLDRFCRLDGGIDCIGLSALQHIAETGPARRIRGLRFDGDPCPPCQHAWPVQVNGNFAGQVTSAIWSPRFEQNVALAMLERKHWDEGTGVSIDCGDGSLRHGFVCDLPMEET